MRTFLLIAVIAVMAVAVGCKDGDDDPPVDNPIQDRSGTVKIFGGASSVTVQVKGMTTKAEWDVIANKIAGSINAVTDPNDQAFFKNVIDNRAVIFIVEANPVGYTNLKMIGDGKTIYISLTGVDAGYATDGIGGISGNASTVS